MRRQSDPRSLGYLPFAFAATVLALAGLFGQTAFAASAPADRTSHGWDGCAVCIVGTPVVQWSGASGSLHVDRVQNKSHSSHMSGNLGLQVQLQSTYPDVWRDSGVGEYEVSDVVPLGPLPIGASRSNIDSGQIAFDTSRVPAGEYFMLVMIVDDFPGWPHFEDFAVMSEKVTCDGSNCAFSRPCSTVRAAGVWGYTKTGTLFAPTGATPFATMGILTLQKDGTLTGINSGSVGGKFSQDVLKGTFEVNPDCTGTTTVGVYDQSGVLLRTIVMTLVLDEDATHLRGLVTSLTLPNGVALSTVITADARRASRGWRVIRNGGDGMSTVK